MEKSREALKILIKGENEAVRNYVAYSKVAMEEGFTRTAGLFDALSKAERIHIKNHLNALGEDYEPQLEPAVTGTTLENIAAAMAGENEESRHLYPGLMRSIKGECSDDYGKVARLSMLWARKVEKKHAKLLKKAYKAMKQGGEIAYKVIYLCQVCGNLELDVIKDDICDVCGHDSQFFNALKGGE